MLSLGALGFNGVVYVIAGEIAGAARAGQAVALASTVLFGGAALPAIPLGRPGGLAGLPQPVAAARRRALASLATFRLGAAPAAHQSTAHPMLPGWLRRFGSDRSSSSPSTRSQRVGAVSRAMRASWSSSTARCRAIAYGAHPARQAPSRRGDRVRATVGRARSRRGALPALRHLRRLPLAGPALRAAARAQAAAGARLAAAHRRPAFAATRADRARRPPIRVPQQARIRLDDHPGRRRAGLPPRRPLGGDRAPGGVPAHERARQRRARDVRRVGPRARPGGLRSARRHRLSAPPRRARGRAHGRAALHPRDGRRRCARRRGARGDAGRARCPAWSASCTP